MEATTSTTQRNALVAFAALVVAIWAILISPSQVQAQEKQEQAAPAGQAGEEPPAPPKEKSAFIWFLETSGLIGLFILCLSVYFVAQVITLFMEFRMQVAMPPALVAATNDQLEKDDFPGVYNTLKNDPSFYGRILSAGMSELPVGLKEAQDVLDRHADACTVEMERKISMLAVLGTLGPMIGLLGTLKGMISSFGVIARTDQQLKASEVAAGISEALILTMEGVALSVPAIYFYAFFKNRMMGIATATTLAADEFLRKFHAKYKSRARATAAAAKTT